MRKYWILDQHGDDGPSALVETDGRLRIIDVLRFGPSIVDLEHQQQIWDKVIGRVAPTMKPLVDASSLKEEGVAPHPKLRRDGHGASAGKRASHGQAARWGHPGVGQAGGSPRRKRSRGDR